MLSFLLKIFKALLYGTALALAGALIFETLTPSAHASVPIHCSEIDYNCNKERDFDPTARRQIRNELDRIIEDTENFVRQTDFTPHPDGVLDRTSGQGFIGPYENFFDYHLNYRGEEFITNLGGISELQKDPYKLKYLEDRLKEPEDILAQLEPDPNYGVSLTQADYDAFYRGEGSDWETFISVALDPRRNVFDLGLLTIDSKVEKENSLEASMRQYLGDNQGFIGERQFWYDCDDLGICWKEFEVLRPGGGTAETFKRALTVDFDWWGNSDEVGPETIIGPEDSEPEQYIQDNFWHL